MRLVQMLNRLIGRTPSDPNVVLAREELHAEVAERLARQEARVRALDIQARIQAPRPQRTPK